jgi:hypothetical protein
VCAHRAIAQHSYSAGVGRHRPAYRRASPAGYLDAEIQVRVRVRDLLQGDPGAGGDLGGLAVDGVRPGQPGRAQNDFAMEWHAAADEAGVPALRHDGHPGVGAQGQHRRDLIGIAWPHHGRRLALEAPRPANGEAGCRVTRQDMLLTHDAGKGPQDRARKRFHVGRSVEEVGGLRGGQCPV